MESIEDSLTGDTDLARFWDNVQVSGDPDDCWQWTAAKDKDGYGRARWRKKNLRAHRLSWEIAFGPIPSGLKVLHHCDHPWCVRPRCLWLGTHGDNVRDKVEKRRQARGDRHGRAKLIEADVHEIRNLRECGFTLRELARMFGVNHSSIGDIVLRKKWAHVA